MANKYHAPYFGRLKQVRRGRNMGGWSARYNNHNQWIQFDLRRLLKLTMVSTQGRKLAKQWVTRYTISTSIDCAHFVPYKQRDRLKVRANVTTLLFLAKYLWVVRYSDIMRFLPYCVDVTKRLVKQMGLFGLKGHFVTHMQSILNLIMHVVVLDRYVFKSRLSIGSTSYVAK